MLGQERITLTGGNLRGSSIARRVTDTVHEMRILLLLLIP